MPSFDLAVIGAGPGGFEAALRARELGFKVALIDKSDPGGTCLHTGCIPTKALLASTKLLSKIKQAKSYGLSVSGISYDLMDLIQRKNRIVETLKKGMMQSIQKAGVEWISGAASFVGKNRLTIDGRGAIHRAREQGVMNDAPTNEIESKYVIIAAGSAPIPFPGVPFDEERVLSSSQILQLKSAPKRLLIIGGSAVGVEFASIYQALGAQVILVEMLERLIYKEDDEIGRRLEALFRRKGIEVHTGAKVKTLTVKGQGIEVLLDSGARLEGDQALIAIGRRPLTEGLGLEKAGVRVEKGAVAVDEYLETSAPGVFAIGDVTSRSTGLAHAATAEGIRVVENLKGPKRKMDYSAIPNCVYSDPEVASVGGRHAVPLQEETIETKIPFSAVGKSHIEGETDGFVKMAALKRDGRILRAAGMGGHITEWIQEAALAIQAGLTVHTLAETVHAHPTESEILQKAAFTLRRIISA